MGETVYLHFTELMHDHLIPLCLLIFRGLGDFLCPSIVIILELRTAYLNVFQTDGQGLREKGQRLGQSWVEQGEGETSDLAHGSLIG